MLVYTSLVHAVVVSGDRYHLVAATQIAMLAGVALDAVWRRGWQAAGVAPVRERPA
jgi:hypothetical protein